MLACPNCSSSGFTFFASELIRNQQQFFNVEDKSISDEDDIKYGIAVCQSCKTAFPIEEFVGVFLSDSDADKGVHRLMLESRMNRLPAFFQECIKETIHRIYNSRETADGQWNRDEMRYYDAEVDTQDKRNRMLENMKSKPVWRIFIPRQQWIINSITPNIKNKHVLEIGGGVCRTVYKLLNPDKFQFHYTGTDISFKRLMVAKAAMPSSDFIQASALNLPFRNGAFDGVLSFGMLHHLPRPEEALEHVNSKLASGGFIGFHEPIIRPEFSQGLTRISRRIFRQYEHSEHDGKINLTNCMQILKSHQHEIISYREQISIVRALTESLAGKFFKKQLNTRSAIKLLEAIDRLFINTICRISRKFGPNAVLVVTKRRS